ncbi:hypothetical protein JD974_04545 [Chromobacterium haemolyticum]|uniref:Uncharacterized protein n=1 Tax=Chromobacterium haemolyticum TaxID=394935 RepID=A0ABS3GJL2_9NEIS|nr:hypothetical protein [Chromobacterium haemolyticum]MBK0413670.1 hypothetical protein [Chromobacterium haemolyticum]MBO0414772.1 hypothetical protein [Chromobacterium haemolyticum]MBO0498033.1 hypothetical protein [Chromobacterium haemolyticum]
MHTNSLSSFLSRIALCALALTATASSLYQGVITARNAGSGKTCFSVDSYRSANKSVAIPAKGLVLTSITVYTETANGAQAIWKINAASRNEAELYKVKSGECLIYGEVVAGKYTVSQAPKPLPASTPLEVVATYWHPTEFNNILSMGGKFCSVANGIIDASEDGSCPGQSAPKKRAKSL